MTSILRPAFLLFVLLSVLTGIVYPAVITGISMVFPRQAGGSLIIKDGKAVGSSLIGQSFSDPKYFWSRPSATAPQPYNAAASSGSNQGQLNPALMDAVKARVQALKDADPDNNSPVPVDLVTASASGLDPDISVAAAEYQIARVTRVRSLAIEKVRAMVAMHTESRALGVFGEPRINVLELNLALDALQ